MNPHDEVYIRTLALLILIEEVLPPDHVILHASHFIALREMVRAKYGDIQAPQITKEIEQLEFNAFMIQCLIDNQSIVPVYKYPFIMKVRSTGEKFIIQNEEDYQLIVTKYSDKIEKQPK